MDMTFFSKVSTWLIVGYAFSLVRTNYGLKKIPCYKDSCERGYEYCVKTRERCYKCEDITHLCNTDELPIECDSHCLRLTMKENEAVSNVTMKKLQEDNIYYNATVTALREETNLLDNTNVHLKEENTRFYTTIVDLQEKNRRCNSTITELYAAINNNSVTIRDLLKINSRLNTTIKNLSEKSKNQSAHIDQLEQEKANFTNQRADELYDKLTAQANETFVWKYSALGGSVTVVAVIFVMWIYLYVRNQRKQRMCIIGHYDEKQPLNRPNNEHIGLQPLPEKKPGISVDGDSRGGNPVNGDMPELKDDGSVSLEDFSTPVTEVHQAVMEEGGQLISTNGDSSELSAFHCSTEENSFHKGLQTVS